MKMHKLLISAMLSLMLLLTGCEDKAANFPEHSVKVTPLPPRSGKRVEIRAEGDFNNSQCIGLIEYYSHLGNPDGQISVRRVVTTGVLKGKWVPVCVENFDGGGVVFNDFSMVNKVEDQLQANKGENSKTAEENKVNLNNFNEFSKLVRSGDFAIAFVFLKIKLDQFDGTQRKEMESLLLEFVRPVPGSDLKKNKYGYQMLTLVAPATKLYHAKLQSYENKIKESANKKKSRLLGKLRKKVDKISKVTFYQHRNKPRFINSRSLVYLYMGESGGDYFLRMKIIYAAKNWLFVNKVTAYRDGRSSILYNGDFKKDNNTSIWEWVDILPSTTQMDILRDMAKSKEVILRFEGNQYREDVHLKSKDKTALKDVLAIYDILTE